MARGHNIWYNYRIWCAETVKEQAKGGVGRYCQEELGKIEGVA